VLYIASEGFQGGGYGQTRTFCAVFSRAGAIANGDEDAAGSNAVARGILVRLPAPFVAAAGGTGSANLPFG